MKRGSIYPSWRYHATEPPVLCLNVDHDDALGAEWSDQDIRQAGVEEKSALGAAEASPDDEPKKRGRRPKA